MYKKIKISIILSGTVIHRIVLINNDADGYYDEVNNTTYDKGITTWLAKHFVRKVNLNAEYQINLSTI